MTCETPHLPVDDTMGIGSRCPGCGYSHDRLGEPPASSWLDCGWLLSLASVDVTSVGVTCDPHNGPSAVDGVAGLALSPSRLVGAMLDGWDRRVERLFRPRPSLAPIFFQLLPDMARCNVFGDVLKAKSDVGGVVGGVIGSPEGGELGLLLLSSVNPSISATSECDPDADPDAVAEVDRLAAALLRPRPSIGRKEAFGDWDVSSADESRSFGILSLDRPCLDSCTSSSARGGTKVCVTDSRKGTRTESFISSCTIRTASSNSDGDG